MFDLSILKNEERAIFALRSIYKDYGYVPYKMAKFEEYDLYVKNKDFLVSDSVITFNDTNGKLLALKPDVTLSIIKNYNDKANQTLRVYYNENVYRVSETTHAYKEIMQTGLECMGNIDIDKKQEVINLAVMSLASISDNFVLEVSDLSLLSMLLELASSDTDFRRKITSCISRKSAHEIPLICKEYGVGSNICEKLCDFASLYGDRDSVLAKLKSLCITNDMEKSYDNLCTLSSEISKLPNEEKVIFDFSVVNDMKYYNGLVFRGFIEGIPEGILSGGQYDNLMKRMGKNAGALGFAVYLDLLEDYEGEVRL